MGLRNIMQLAERHWLVWLQRAYFVIASLLSMSIAVQVFLAGLNVFGQPRWWGTHIQAGHWIGVLVLALVLLAFVGRFLPYIRWLTIAVLGLYGMQYNFRQIAALFGVPQLAALHAVNALVLFWCATMLARQSWRVVRFTRTDTPNAPARTVTVPPSA